MHIPNPAPKEIAGAKSCLSHGRNGRLVFRRRNILIVLRPRLENQVRQCYLHGTEKDGSAGKVVARMLNTAVSAGKRARSETSISKGAF